MLGNYYGESKRRHTTGERPTKEEVEGWLRTVQSGLIDQRYRDVFLKLPEILRAYLALREEVEAVKCENQAMIPYVELVDKLEADNQSLREQISALEGHIVGEEVEP